MGNGEISRAPDSLVVIYIYIYIYIFVLIN